MVCWLAGAAALLVTGLLATASKWPGGARQGADRRGPWAGTVTAPSPSRHHHRHQRSRERHRADWAWSGAAEPPTPPPYRISDTLTDMLTESEEEYLRTFRSRHGPTGSAPRAASEPGVSPRPGQASSASDSRGDPERNIGIKFLQLVESQQRLGENCTAGTDFQLEGVVDRYGQERFRFQAELTVKMANLLTRLWRYSADMMNSETLLHALVLSLIEADDDIFAAGNCYDQGQYKDYRLYCPFAYRLPEGGILSKDLAREYDYMSNTSEWFYKARNNALKLIHWNAGHQKDGPSTFDGKSGANSRRTNQAIKPVTFLDGFWSKPYFDCGGGNIWMMTYTVPFFGYKNGVYFFKGTSGIDIDLRRVDIDQCPQRRNSSDVNIFAGSDKCKETTTRCVSVPGLGFRRGSYKCECKEGYYFPALGAHRFYNGTAIEDEYEKKLQSLVSRYDEPGMFECLPCAEGCGTCDDGRPCLLTLNWAMRAAILSLAAVITGVLPFVVFFTIKYGEIKVVRAASPALLRIIILGAFFIYSTTIMSYPEPTVVTCTVRCWLREIGFSLSYGALMLKTWRISVIFRIRSAKAVKITDMDLLKRLGLLVTGFSTLLAVRSLVSPPPVIMVLSADNLKTRLCHIDWWDHAFSATELLFLVWGIRLCIVVRKAPSEFNESKFISLTIYNEFLLTVLLKIATMFLASPANPDLLYIIFFLHNQLTITVLLVLIFGSKVYMVMKGQGRSEAAAAMKATSAKLYGSKASECSNPVPAIAGSHLATIDLLKMPDIDVQSELDKITRYLEFLASRERPPAGRTSVAQLEAMLAASRHQSARPDHALQDGVGMANHKVDTLLASVTGQLVTSVVGAASPAVDVSEAQVQTCLTRRHKRHSATQTVRSMALTLRQSTSPSSASRSSDATESPGSAASPASPGSPPAASTSTFECGQSWRAPSAARSGRLVTRTAHLRRLRRRRRMRSLQPVRLSDSARFTEAVVV